MLGLLLEKAGQQLILVCLARKYSVFLKGKVFAVLYILKLHLTLVTEPNYSLNWRRWFLTGALHVYYSQYIKVG